MKRFYQASWRASLLLVTIITSSCANLSETYPKVHTNVTDQQRHLSKITTIKDFKLSGRVAINANNQGSSGTIFWHHAYKDGNISFHSPLGGKVADFLYTNQNVKFTNKDNKTFEADNAETLSERHLGWRLPLKPLSDWVLGRPSTGAISDMRWDEQGRITRFNQEGWEITYLEYKPNQEISLPSKINIRGVQTDQPLNLRLVIDVWEYSITPSDTVRN
jgi:outer membrane lipoprotein LolB